MTEPENRVRRSRTAGASMVSEVDRTSLSLDEGGTPSDFRLNRRVRLADEVTERLLRRIVAGKFPSGTFLPAESELAEQFGVSRPVVRESIRELEGRGVIHTRHGRGSVVASRDAWSSFDPLVIGVRLELEGSAKLFADLAEVRIGIECQLTHAAALHADKVHLEALRKLVDLQMEPTTPADAQTDTDMRFHEMIADASGNDVGRGIMSTFAPSLRAMRIMTNQIPGAFSHAVADHQRILDLIELHDAAGAETAMRDHLSWSRDHLLSYLEETRD